MLPIATFSELEGQLLRTRIDVRCAPMLGRPQRASLQLLGEEGPSARVARALELPALRPSLAFHTREFRAICPRACRSELRDWRAERNGRRGPASEPHSQL